ncbi:PilZ domain-containing protein [Legionella cardiaca]|uniref:PilZ domain-containing protein n=1 Tax=Legionella cardiaca TaxID=1071983 RepID=A0ABY8AU54_9GAMM|nr:PilZ domain-containing protein [Legionella cardiaca]WED44222.1 PilZ domain-containing protein [Legionella cardiaca]
MSTTDQKISCSFNDKNSLYLAYMPFIENGGLFIRNYQHIKPGTFVILCISLLKEPLNYKIRAKVIWSTPTGALGNRVAGIGLQFVDENHQDFSNKIETYLANMLESIHATDTM